MTRAGTKKSILELLGFDVHFFPSLWAHHTYVFPLKYFWPSFLHRRLSIQSQSPIPFQMHCVNPWPISHSLSPATHVCSSKINEYECTWKWIRSELSELTNSHFMKGLRMSVLNWDMIELAFKLFYVWCNMAQQKHLHKQLRSITVIILLL